MAILFNASGTLDPGSGLALLQNVAGGTLMGWGTMTEFTNSRSIIGFQGNTGTTRAKITVTASTGIPTVRANALDADATSSFNGGVAITNGVLFHFASTFNFSAGTGIIYINGVVDTAGSFANMTHGNTSNTAAALAKLASQENGTSNQWIGKLEDVRLYNRALSANEIRTIYAQRGRDGIFQGCTGRWPLMSLGDTVSPAAGASIKDISNSKFHLTNTGTNVFSKRIASVDRRRAA
jgi:hypothetical protein